MFHLSSNAAAVSVICLMSGIIWYTTKLDKFVGEVYIDIAKGETEAYIDEVLKVFGNDEKKKRVFVRIVPGYLYTKKDGLFFYKDSVIRVSAFIWPFGIGGEYSRKVNGTLAYLKEKTEQSGLRVCAEGVY
jgi:hypothetical protein